MGRLIQVTSETDLVGRRRRQFGRVLDCGSVRRFGMFLAGTMAGIRTLALHPRLFWVSIRRCDS